LVAVVNLYDVNVPSLVSLRCSYGNADQL